MRLSPKNQELAGRLNILVFLLFFIGFIFSFRAVSSIATGLLLVSGLSQHASLGRISAYRPLLLFLSALLFYFLIACLSLLLNRQEGGMNDLLMKTGLLLIPFSVMLAMPLSEDRRRFLLKAYCLVLLAGAVYCLGWQVLTRQSTGFFYHALVKPLGQHAVYFSIYVFAALAILFDSILQKKELFKNHFLIPLLLFFSVFLVLLSSKIVLAFYAVYLVIFFVQFSGRKSGSRRSILLPALAAGFTLVIVFSTSNPVSNRFRDVLVGQTTLIARNNYDPGVYFNGIQFRLLQWKLVPAILNETGSWWKGTGAAQAQERLDDQYRKRNMYLGSASGDLGYRAFNTHNQFLESLLSYGIPGLLAFLLIWLAMARLVFSSAKTAHRIVVCLILIYSLLESLLETQYGILLFGFFPVFFLLIEQPTGKRSLSIKDQTSTIP